MTTVCWTALEKHTRHCICPLSQMLQGGSSPIAVDIRKDKNAWRGGLRQRRQWQCKVLGYVCALCATVWVSSQGWNAGLGNSPCNRNLLFYNIFPDWSQNNQDKMTGFWNLPPNTRSMPSFLERNGEAPQGYRMLCVVSLITITASTWTWRIESEAQERGEPIPAVISVNRQ